MHNACFTLVGQDQPTKKDPKNLASAKVNVELRFQSEYCSVSKNPSCFLQITLRFTGSARISLNRARPIIEFLEAKDDDAPGGLPLLSLYDAAESTGPPVFSYQLDLCYEQDRERQLQKDSHRTKPEDFIVLSSEAYTFSHCVNLPWSYIFTYHQISKIRVQGCYKLGAGLLGDKKAQGIWYPDKNEAQDEVRAVHLELDQSSKAVIRLVD